MTDRSARAKAEAHRDAWLDSLTLDELKKWVRQNSCLCDMAGICNGCKRADAEYENRWLWKCIDIVRAGYTKGQPSSMNLVIAQVNDLLEQKGIKKG